MLHFRNARYAEWTYVCDFGHAWEHPRWLEALRATYFPSLGEIIEGGGTDYQFRAHASHQDVGRALSQVVNDIDYSNFKNTLSERRGKDHADVYSNGWLALQEVGELADTSELPEPDASPDLETERKKRFPLPRRSKGLVAARACPR